MHRLRVSDVKVAVRLRRETSTDLKQRRGNERTNLNRLKRAGLELGTDSVSSDYSIFKINQHTGLQESLFSTLSSRNAFRVIHIGELVSAFFRAIFQSSKFS